MHLVYVRAAPAVGEPHGPLTPTVLNSHTDACPHAGDVAKSTMIEVGVAPNAKWNCSGPPLGPPGWSGGVGEGCGGDGGRGGVGGGVGHDLASQQHPSLYRAQFASQEQT